MQDDLSWPLKWVTASRLRTTALDRKIREKRCGKRKKEEEKEKGKKGRRGGWLTLWYDYALASFTIRILPLCDILRSDSATCKKLSVHLHAAVLCQSMVNLSDWHTRATSFLPSSSRWLASLSQWLPHWSRSQSSLRWHSYGMAITFGRHSCLLCFSFHRLEMLVEIWTPHHPSKKH